MNIYRYLEKDNGKIVCPHCKKEAIGRIEFMHKGQYIVCPSCRTCF